MWAQLPRGAGWCKPLHRALDAPAQCHALLTQGHLRNCMPGSVQLGVLSVDTTMPAGTQPCSRMAHEAQMALMRVHSLCTWKGCSTLRARSGPTASVRELHHLALPN